MNAVSNSVSIVAYLALFGGVGFAFVFVNLLIGRFLRPDNPHPEKLEIYECGEPTIGTSFVQFDLRFYVVALVFIIFDVEVAFLFPWATVFGKAMALADPRVTMVVVEDQTAHLTGTATGLLQELGVRHPELVVGGGTAGALQQELHVVGSQLMWLSVWAAGFFFLVLLIGLAYEWRSGALDWVRAVAHGKPHGPPRKQPQARPVQESVWSA